MQKHGWLVETSFANFCTLHEKYAANKTQSRHSICVKRRITQDDAAFCKLKTDAERSMDHFDGQILSVLRIYDQLIDGRTARMFPERAGGMRRCNA